MVTQGAQFVGLAYLPLVTVSLLLSCTVVLVALLGIFLLGERPTAFQWAGVLLYLAGIALYFYPVSIPPGQTLGICDRAYILSDGAVLGSGRPEERHP